MKRNGRTYAIAAVAAASLTAAVAWAAHGPHGGPFGHRGIAAHIDQALDAVNATPAQREAIDAARDNVFDTMKQAHQSMRGDMQQALKLFEADRIDTNQLNALQKKREAVQKQVGDAIVLAIRDAHDALTAQQRKQLVDWMRANRPAQPFKERHGDLMKHMAKVRVDDLLDAAKATDAQRQTIQAAVDRALATLQQNRENHQAMMDEVLSLFSADKLDQSKIDAFRARAQAAHQKTADAIVSVIQTAHDTLQPAQRRAVVAFVQAHHGRHHGG